MQYCNKFERPPPSCNIELVGRIPLKRNGSGSVGVLKYAIGYIRLPYFRSLWIFPGICPLSGRFFTFFHPEAQGLSSILWISKIDTDFGKPLKLVRDLRNLQQGHSCLGIPVTSGWPKIFGNTQWIWVLPDISGYPLPENFQNWMGSGTKKMLGSGLSSVNRWAL